MSTIQQEVLHARIKKLRENNRLDGEQTLANFDWKRQRDALLPIRNWLKLWTNYHVNGGESPLPILHIWGATNKGKSHAAAGIGRYFGMNLGSFVGTSNLLPAVLSIPTIQWVSWSKWLKATLKNKAEEISDNASLLIIDDIDSYKPVPEKMSTWAVQEANDLIRYRCEDLKLPTVITGNWDPDELGNFFSTNSVGDSSPDTIKMAEKLSSIIVRNSYAQVRFTGNDTGTGTKTWRVKGQDMKELGFNWFKIGMLF